MKKPAKLKTEKEMTTQPNKIINYTVICGHSSQELIRLANDRLQYNWQPLGGLFIDTTSQQDYIFWQTMVMYERKEDTNVNK